MTLKQMFGAQGTFQVNKNARNSRKIFNIPYADNVGF